VAFTRPREARLACVVLDGRTWLELEPQFFARRADALCFLGDEHLVAVLPLYLHLFVVWPYSPVSDDLVSLLMRPEPNETLYEWKKRRFEGVVGRLSERQSRVVAATLRHYIELNPNEAEPAARALERYWTAFLARSRASAPEG